MKCFITLVMSLLVAGGTTLTGGALGPGNFNMGAHFKRTMVVGGGPPSAGFSFQPGFSGSGTFSAGQTFTINRPAGGFGTKSPVKPYLWAPFDTDQNPSSLGVRTSWDDVQSMSWVSSGGDDGGGYLGANDSSGAWAAQVTSSGFAWNDYNFKWYLFRKQRRNFSYGAELNWKNIRLWNTGFTGPNFHVSPANGSIEWESVSGGDTTYITDLLAESRGPVNQWFTEEMLWQANSNSAANDGFFQFWVEGLLVREIPYFDVTTRHAKMRSTDGDAGKMVIFYPIHGVKANTTFTTERYYADSVYLDTCLNRVLVGDTANYNAHTAREVQIPTAWSDTSVTMLCRNGEMVSLVGKHLFVVNNNNTVFYSGVGT